MMAALSALQKQILSLALKNRETENRTEDAQSGADLYYSEILVSVYGFEPIESLRTRDGRRKSFGKKFDVGAIGKDRYNSAMAAISRAVLRLDQRGLVTALRGTFSRWSGCDLTDDGVRTANTVGSTDHLNHSAGCG
jgi:hypothetical protein